MAISEKIASALELARIGGRSARGEQPWRIMCASPEVVEFIKRIWAENPPSHCEADLTPREQLASLIRRYTSGDELFVGTEFHILLPAENAVWELKTPDFRLFGWFAAKDLFVALAIDWADRVKEHGLYSGYRDEVARRRAESGADVSACIWSTDDDAVVSVRTR